jgi:ribulose-5-phosphate 4-epimerase/fuculose-1-phosphate aldolase
VAHRWAARWGWHESVINHFTALVPGRADRFFAIPYDLHWDEVKARDFLVVDLEGRVLEGEGEIELSSLLIHGAMHRDLPQAKVVLHTHQPHITALTCLEDQTVEMCRPMWRRCAWRPAKRVWKRAPYISGRCDACCGARSRTLLVRADQ